MGSMYSFSVSLHLSWRTLAFATVPSSATSWTRPAGTLRADRAEMGHAESQEGIRKTRREGKRKSRPEILRK